MVFSKWGFVSVPVIIAAKLSGVPAIMMVGGRIGTVRINEVLRKANVLIPLPASASRGDQLFNAESFKVHVCSFVLEEERMNAVSIIEAVDEVYAKREVFIDRMMHSKSQDGVSHVVEVIRGVIGER